MLITRLIVVCFVWAISMQSAGGSTHRSLFLPSEPEPTPFARALQDAGGGDQETSLLDTPPPGADKSNSDLAAKAQNPIANMISLPFQNNTNFDVGPSDGTVNVLNIQPVYPITFDDFNVITRTIAPIIYKDKLFPGDSSEFGLGDIQFTPFFSPNNTEKYTWGVGPIFRFPTATDDSLGSDKWSAGISAVVIATPKPWVVGALIQNVWSYAGDSSADDVNEFLFQPIINYNFGDGWYATSVPIITADWEAPSGDQWTVPLGGGVGRTFRIGSQPINISVQAYYNVVTPDDGAAWQLRIQVQLLFPK